MNWRTRDKIILAICSGEDLYIKDTGIKVIVEYFGTDLHNRREKVSANDRLCSIEFSGMPSSKALSLCREFHIKRNSHSNKIEVNASIELKNLSIKPFESRAANVLYNKPNKKENKNA